MDISNKHYRDMQRKIDSMHQKVKINDRSTKLNLTESEKQRDSIERNLADSIGIIIGHFLFKSRQ